MSSDQRGDGGAGDEPRAAMLAHVFARDLVERFAVQPCRQHRDALVEARIAGRDLLASARPREVEPQRLRLEHAGERAGQRVGDASSRNRRRPRPRAIVPSVRTISSVSGGRSAIQYSTSRWHHFDWAERGEARKMKNRECGERGLDGAGKVVRRGEAGAVAEDVDGAQLPPRLGEAMQRGLQRRGEPAVGAVRIGDESVVGQSSDPEW